MLKFGKARDQPAHREGRQCRHAKGASGLRAALDTQRSTCQPVERWTCFGQKILAGPCRHGIPARAHKKSSPEPILEQTDLPADGAMGDVELLLPRG